MESKTILVGAVMLVLGIVIGVLGSMVVMSPRVEVTARSTQEVTPNAEPTATHADSDEPTDAEEPDDVEESADTNEPSNTPSAQQPTRTTADERLSPQDAILNLAISSTRHFKGDPDAPVTMIQFSDFQCPYCSRFAAEAGQKIYTQYVDTGKVRFGYKHFVFLGDGSLAAAEASECAADQDKFWEYHDRIVEHVVVEGKRDFSHDNLKAFAAELDLDSAAFAQCIDSGKYTDLVISETQESQNLGVQSTPSFFINTQRVSGALPFANFQQLIEAELNK